MNKLQKALDRALVSAVPKIQSELVRKKFRESGVTLTPQQASEFLNNIKAGKFTLEVPDEQVDCSVLAEASEKGINIEFTGKEADEVIRLIPDVIKRTSHQFANMVLRQIRKQMPSHVSERISDREAFKRRLWTRWKRPLELFHLYLAICNESAAEFNKFHRPEAVKQNDLVFEVLVRLQARGCQIALEVVTLLESGLADGAHARWRSLHEVACVAMFISQHGQKLADKYLLHDLVQTYKSAKRYEEWRKALHHRPISQRALARQERDYQTLIKQFGANFSGDYGWAAEELGKAKPSFADIEKAVGLEKLRPYYRMASDNVHANVRGISFKLGLPDGNKMLLAGASDTGLADPGDGAAMSLHLLTTTLLTSKPNVDTLVRCAILTDLQRQIGTAFLKAAMAQKKARPRSRKL
jgi:hypothetical protein